MVSQRWKEAQKIKKKKDIHGKLVWTQASANGLFKAQVQRVKAAIYPPLVIYWLNTAHKKEKKKEK